jgi:MFS family permease
MVWFAAAGGMPLTMLLETLGASGMMIGLAMAVQQIAIACQLPGSIVADQLRQRRNVWFAFALPHRLLWIPVALVPLFVDSGPRAAAIVVVFVGISACFANMATPAWLSWMSELVPPGESGRFWGSRQVFTTAAFLVATGLMGRFLDFGTAHARTESRFAFAVVFGVTAFFGILDIVIHMFVKAPPESPLAKGTPLRDICNIARDRHFLMLTLAFCLWGFGLGVMNPFAPVFLKRQFDATYTHLALLTITFSTGAIVAGFFWGKAMDAIGARTFGTIVLLAIPLFSLPWFLLSTREYSLPWLGRTPEAIVVYALVNFLAGAFFSGVTLCQLNLVTTLTTQYSRTLAVGLHFCVTGLVGSIGPTVGGYMMERFSYLPHSLVLPRGIVFSFFHAQLVLHMLAAILATWVFHKTTPLVTDVPIRQLLGTPLRMLTIIQNLLAISTPRNQRPPRP